MEKPKVSKGPPDPRHSDDYVRLPGLFRRYELEQVIDLENEYFFEDAGRTAAGVHLVAVYRREPPPDTGARPHGGRP
jgi:hypothetical protein